VSDVLPEVSPAGTQLHDVLQPPKPDMASVEDQLCLSVLAQAKAAILSLASMLDDPKTAARALHLIGETAAVQQEMLMSLGLPGAGRRNRGKVGVYQMSGGLLGSGGGDTDESEQGSVGLVGASVQPGGETFANQVVSQIVAMAKQFMPKPGAVAVKPTFGNGMEVDSLTRALCEAKAGKLSRDVIDGIEARLLAAIAIGTAVDSGVAAEPESPAPSPAPGPAATFMAGLTAGFQPVAPGAEE